MIGSYSFDCLPQVPEHLVLKERTPSPLYNLPNELVYEVLNKVASSDLLSIRLTSSYLCRLANLILSSRKAKETQKLKLDYLVTKSAKNDLEQTLSPHLTHYRQFLSNLNTTEIAEAAWYKIAPSELHTVCTTLVILYNSGIDEEVPHGQSLSWSTVKKSMSTRTFKDWFRALSTGVNQINYRGVKQVEAIIQRDQDITYERLREVSNPGYRLLIVVAAVLQYSNLNESILVEVRTLKGLEGRLRRNEVFMGYLAASQSISCQSMLPFLPEHIL